MPKRNLIINADGYGFTEGITRATEECIAFGTVRSISANINFPHAENLDFLVRKYPDLSVGCHLNPVVGRPVLSASQVPTLVDRDGSFFYKKFNQRINSGHINLQELKLELMAQIEKCKSLAGKNFTHIDCHMGKHRLPKFYPLFLEVVKESGIGRIRTHKDCVGLESSFPKFEAGKFYLSYPLRIVYELWDLFLRKRALNAGLAMPDRTLAICNMGRDLWKISIQTWLSMMKKCPVGFSEFIVHPAYIDDELKKWATYVDARENERKILLSPNFKKGLDQINIVLCGYKDIPVCLA